MLFRSDDIDQSASSSTKQQSDETLEDIKAIAELEPSGIFHIAVLFSLFTNCINSICSAAFSYCPSDGHPCCLQLFIGSSLDP